MARNVKIKVDNLDFYYGTQKALSNITMSIEKNRVTGLIGPSGCGKSTFLRCLNRMNDIIPGTRVTGSIQLDGSEIYDPSMDVVQLRCRVGMVFQKSNPFPKNIYDNVAYGLRINGWKDRRAIEERVEESLSD